MMIANIAPEKKSFVILSFNRPVGYNLSSEYKKLIAKCKTCNQRRITGFNLNGTNNEDIWICKPAGLSQGRGISLFQVKLTH